MMSVSSRQPLIRISKNGEMRLKNKVGVAILKENAHEDRALNSQIVALQKHQERQDKYMTYRQLDFATKQITASEERPHTIATTVAPNDNSLPPIHAINLNDESMRRRTNTNAEDVGDLKPQKSKGTWEKAMALVRVAVRNKQRQELAEQSKTFITQNSQFGRRGEHQKVGIKDLESTSLSPLRTTTYDTTMRYSRHGPKKLSRRQPSYPEMLKMSREKSKVGLQDPRFLKLESCLGGGLRRRSIRRSFRDASETTELSSEVDRKRTKGHSVRE